MLLPKIARSLVWQARSRMSSHAQTGSILQEVRRAARLLPHMSGDQELKLYSDLTNSFRNQLHRRQQLEETYGDLLLSSLVRLDLSYDERLRLQGLLEKDAEALPAQRRVSDLTTAPGLPDLYQVMTRVTSATEDEYAMAIQLAARFSSLAQAEQIYDLAKGRLPASRHNTVAGQTADIHSAMLETYLLHNRPDNAFALYTCLAPELRSLPVYTVLLHGLRKRNQLSNALAVYDDMRHSGLDPILAAHNVPLNVNQALVGRAQESIVLLAVKALNVDLALEIWQAHSVTPLLRLSAQAWAALWLLFVRHDLLGEARQLLNHMESMLLRLPAKASSLGLTALCQEIRRCTQDGPAQHIANAWELVSHLSAQHGARYGNNELTELLQAACCVAADPRPLFDSFALFPTHHAQQQPVEDEPVESSLATLGKLKALVQVASGRPRQARRAATTTFAPSPAPVDPARNSPTLWRLEQLCRAVDYYMAHCPSPNVSLVIGQVSDAGGHIIANHDNDRHQSPSALIQLTATYRRRADQSRSAIRFLRTRLGHLPFSERLVGATLEKLDIIRNQPEGAAAAEEGEQYLRL
ncbi:hypothetical protein RI367_000579 [Sorochytrium milnesiophthora]